MVEADKGFASSYYNGTRAAESMYFPIEEDVLPVTIYARFIEAGNLKTSSGRILQISDSGNSNPKILIDSNGTYYEAAWYDGSGTTRTSTLSAAPSIGDVVELRATLKADGKIQIHQSINGASETSASESAALALPAAWSGGRLYLAGIATSGFTAHQAIKIVRGIHDRAYMRAVTQANYRKVA
jgi:hypothetical protein